MNGMRGRGVDVLKVFCLMIELFRSQTRISAAKYANSVLR